MSDDAQAVIEAIREAFRGVPRGETTLHEGEVIDDYGSAEKRGKARRVDVERRWEDVPNAHVESCMHGIYHVDPASWRYYIPRYMVWSIENFQTNSSLLSDLTIYQLAPPNESHTGLRKHALERYRMLDAAQSRAVALFLHYMAQHDDDADAYAASEALRIYWGRFLAQN